MSLKVLNNPIYSIIQDNGRFNHTHLGISVSGVMDDYSFHIANLLLNNKKNTNILEINFANVSFEVQEDTSIAITGAICEFYINDTLNLTWQTYDVKKGDILKVGKFIEGLRVYLSVKGGFIVQKKIWGLSTQKIKKNEILKYIPNTLNYTKRLKEKYIPKYKEELILRVMLSYQNNDFEENEINKFFSNTYTVSNEISRMGYKLKGEAINCNVDGIVSEGIAFGSIQIPKDGQPIILLKDRQTIGGYPKIGVVLDIDCYKLSQAKPNTKIKFQQINFDEAYEKSKGFLKI